MVVCFSTRAPSAHWANVTLSAPAAVKAARIRGRSNSGAWSAMRGHHAGLVASPQSAGFSSIHGTPASCAA
eukprot:2112686-Pleurochrysis_carterae.AAC.1